MNINIYFDVTEIHWLE